jgi:hypothetical protein
MKPKETTETAAKKLSVLNLEETTRIAAQLAEFGKPFDESYRIGLLKAGGLKYACHYAECCMGWIWRQWLAGISRSIIRQQVEPFIERALELRKRSQSYDHLPQHDLFISGVCR